MTRSEKLREVLNNPVLKYAFQAACKYRQLNENDRSVGGKRVGAFKYTCTRTLIAEIVYDNHQRL